MLSQHVFVVNVYNLRTITAFMAIKIMLRMEFDPDRLCFGGDLLFGLMHVQLAIYRALLWDYDEEAQAMVLRGNLARVLGLEPVF